MQPALDLSGRAALVAGGGQGIGRATVLLLAQLGAKVAVLDEIDERAEAVAAEARALGGRGRGARRRRHGRGAGRARDREGAAPLRSAGSTRS